MSECNYYQNTVHRQQGFVDRYDYFTNLAQIYGIPIMKIILKAEQLGIEKDFTELVEWVSQEAMDCYSTRNK